MNSKNSPSPQVLIVEASAGSGKTYELASHYLKLLLNRTATPQQIENILAITFTNKAAREMKERILELVKKIALDKFSSPEEERNALSCLAIDKKKAQAKASELMDYIIANYNFFQIKTIDSFINMILLGCAYRLGLSANFKIKDDRREYLAYSLDECIDRANHDKEIKKLFDVFLHQYIYLEEKSSWLPKSDIVQIVSSLFYNANIYGGRFERSPFESKDIFQAKCALLRLVRGFSEKMPDNLNGTFRNAIQRFAERHPESFDFSEFAKKSFMTDELPVTGQGGVPPAIRKLWIKIRKEIIALAEKEASSLFNCYIDIFEMVYEVFRKTASQDDVLFLEELNRQARTLINENGVTVPERYYGIATRLKHFLIDEFQDTSILQWHNLLPMIVETLSTGGSLFYVGDKKQAIFRFRGGEASLFDSIQDAFVAYAKKEPLKVNYRSQKEIVEFNNAVFAQGNLTRFLLQQQPSDNELKAFNEEDMKYILDIFLLSQQDYKKDGEHEFGRVNVELLECHNSEEKKEKAKVRFLALIAQLKKEKRFCLRDIAVLCRDNACVELVSGWLIESDIAVESEKTLNVKNNQYIKEIISLLTFLNSPIDNLSFAGFIMGDIFVKAAGQSRQKIQDFLFEIKEKTKNQRGFYMYREFRKRYPDIWDEYIDGLYNSVGFIGLYELTIDIYKTLKVLRNFPEQQGFFMHFLQLIKDSEEEHQGVADFLEYLQDLKDEKLYVNSSDVEAIKVMTIHKAKGLGFGAVIIPFLEFDTNFFFASSNKANVSYTIEQRGEALSLVRLDKKYALLSPSLRCVYKEEYRKAFIDELNVIYVALTRAKNELYIFIPHGIQRSNNIAKFLIPDGYLQRGELHTYPKESETGAASLLVSCPEYKEWVNFIREEFQDVNTIKNRQNIIQGKILHEILSCIGNLLKTDKEEALQKGLLKAAVVFPFIDSFEDLESIIRNALDSKNTKDLFYVADGDVYQEKDVVDCSGITKRIDRLIVKKDEVWIVDYKTKGEFALEYKEQLDVYMGIIALLYPKRKMRGFILFLEDCRVEEIHG